MLRVHKSMLVLAVTMILAFGVFASNESVSNEVQNAIIGMERRVERSVTHAQKNCETWTQWVNDNHPTSLKTSDQESMTPKSLGDFCPEGRITDFECKDNNGEGFSKKNITDPNGYFFISCYDVNVGVTCTVLNPGSQCPDMSIKYYCSCKLPPTRATTQSVKTSASTKSMMKSTTHTSLKSSVDPVPSEKVTTHSAIGNKTNAQSDVGNETTLDIGSFSLPWWAFVLVVSGLLFILNTCISVCLYKKGAQRLKKKHKRTIHPLQSV